jgi:ribonuclease D
MAASVQIVDAPRALAQVIEGASMADRLALDIEGNGLFVYRSRLCTVQLAWTEGSETRLVVVDPLAVAITPLAGLLGPSGPPKVLHDCTFDARMLHEAGVVLGRVTDTSVMARMLGRKETGLAALLGTELGIALSKRLQHHDWSRRPLRPEHIEYLGSDVAHLAKLSDILTVEIARAGIDDEVAEECAYKLRAALAPAREGRPAIQRIKGSEKLDALAMVLLRRFVAAREAVALLSDLPPFRVASNETLVAIARTCQAPADPSAIRTAASSARPDLVRAVLDTLDRAPDPDAPHERLPPPNRAVLVQRRTRHRRIAAWRRAEAAARGVDEQVVLPGHCLADVVEVEDASVDAIENVDGLGRARFARYGSVIAALLAGDEDL